MPVRKIPLLGEYGRGKFTLVDGDYDGEYFAQFKWYLNYKTGYAFRRNPLVAGHHHWLHHEVLPNLPKGYFRDHINRDRLDNRSENLRFVTYSENALNKKINPRKGRSGYLGVSQNHYHNPEGKLCYSPNSFFAAILGKRIGTFRSVEEAARAYDMEARKTYGEKATLNFS